MKVFGSEARITRCLGRLNIVDARIYRNHQSDVTTEYVRQHLRHGFGDMLFDPGLHKFRSDRDHEDLVDACQWIGHADECLLGI